MKNEHIARHGCAWAWILGDLELVQNKYLGSATNFRSKHFLVSKLWTLLALIECMYSVQSF